MRFHLTFSNFLSGSIKGRKDRGSEIRACLLGPRDPSPGLSRGQGVRREDHDWGSDPATHALRSAAPGRWRCSCPPSLPPPPPPRLSTLSLVALTLLRSLAAPSKLALALLLLLIALTLLLRLSTLSLVALTLLRSLAALRCSR